MSVIDKTITAIHHKYEGNTAKVAITDIYLDDGTKLSLDGYWMFLLGVGYRITYNTGNPADIESVQLTGIRR